MLDDYSLRLLAEIGIDVTVLAQSAAAKRSLWGEIKRLSRAQTDRRPHP